MIARAADLAAATTMEDNRSETLALRLRAHLQALATRRLPITYREAAKGLLLLPPNTIHQVTEALEQIMAEDAAADPLHRGHGHQQVARRLAGTGILRLCGSARTLHRRCNGTGRKGVSCGRVQRGARLV
jgi:hypothetical protein